MNLLNYPNINTESNLKLKYHYIQLEK